MGPLSYSRARVFDECPAKFKHQYVDHLAVPAEVPMIMGSLIHEVCDRYVTHLKITRKSSDFDQMGKIFDDVWAGSWSGGLSESSKAEAQELCTVAASMLVFEKPGIIAGTELKLAVDAEWRSVDYYDPNAYFRGRIDRLDIDEDGHALVVDYKSGWRMEAVGNTFQTPLYAALAKAHWPEIQSLEVALIYFRYARENVGRVAEEELGRARDWLAGIHAGIQKAQDRGYPARPGWACRTCPAFKSCPARVNAIAAVPPPDEKSAYGMVERLIMVSREREELMEALKPWVDQFGDIDVNGMVLGFKPKNRRTFETKPMWELLESRGIRPLDYFKVDANALKKAVRRDRGLGAEIEKISYENNITELKLYATGE